MPKKPSPFAHGPSEYKERPAFTKAITRERRRLGAQLRRLRNEQSLTRQIAAEKAGVHPVAIARIEAGQQNVTISTLVALALAYDVPLVRFFEEME